MFHSPGIVSRFDDLAMMGDPVKHGGGHFLIAEDLGPFPEGEIGGNDDRSLFVKFGDQVKEQLAGVLGERQIPQFVEYDQVEA